MKKFLANIILVLVVPVFIEAGKKKDSKKNEPKVSVKEEQKSRIKEGDVAGFIAQLTEADAKKHGPSYLHIAWRKLDERGRAKVLDAVIKNFGSEEDFDAYSKRPKKKIELEEKLKALKKSFELSISRVQGLLAKDRNEATSARIVQLVHLVVDNKEVVLGHKQEAIKSAAAHLGGMSALDAAFRTYRFGYLNAYVAVYEPSLQYWLNEQREIEDAQKKLK